MSSSSEESFYGSSDTAAAASSWSEKKYKGVRRRKWGKWVSEIRVPGTPERIWLGSYATPEGAVVAHDVAFYCLRGNSSPQNLNFALVLPASARVGMSPRSVQKAASDAGLAIDARFIDSRNDENSKKKEREENKLRQSGSFGSESSSRKNEEFLDISVEDYL